MALTSATPIMCHVFSRVKSLACCRRSQSTLREAAVVHKQEVVVVAKEGATQKRKARRRACKDKQDTVAEALVSITQPVDDTVPEVIVDESDQADVAMEKVTQPVDDTVPDVIVDEIFSADVSTEVEDCVADTMPAMMSWAAITEAESDEEDMMLFRKTSVGSCDSNEPTGVCCDADQPSTPPGTWVAKPSAGSRTTASDASEAGDSTSEPDACSTADSFSENFAAQEEDELPWQIRPVPGGVYGVWPEEGSPPGIWLMSGYVSSEPFDQDECYEVVKEEKAEFVAGSSSPTTASECGESVGEQSDNHASVGEEPFD